MADEERFPAHRRPSLQLPRRADAALERNRRLRGPCRRAPEAAVLSLERVGRRGGGRTQERRHLDSDADEIRRPRSPGAIRLPRRRGGELPGRELRLAALSRFPRARRRGPRLTMTKPARELINAPGGLLARVLSAPDSRRIIASQRNKLVALRRLRNPRSPLA